MTNLFLKIKEQLAAQRPFAVYSKPGSNTVTGIFQTDATGRHLTDFTQKGFVFAPFEGDNYLFIPEEDSDILTVTIPANGFAPSEPEPAAINPDAKAEFEGLVAQCVSVIKEGKFGKLVASRAETAQLRSHDVTTVYQNLLYAYPNAFKYCFYHPDSDLWMGATPEQLLKAQNHTIHTVALAGTQLYKEGEEAVWEKKEKEEQQFVTDFILSELKDYIAQITTTQPYTYRAGNLVHIKTDISAELKDAGSLKNVVQTLHPTPAVCGLPKTEAKDFILQHEGYNREYYSGFLGELNLDFALGKDNQTDLFVNLRCMKIQDKTATLYIGCGITKDSNPEKEFIETVNKSMTMRRVL